MSNKTEIITLPCGTKVYMSELIDTFQINEHTYALLDKDFIELFDELLEKEIELIGITVVYENKCVRDLYWDDVKGWC
jgi:hypothetical protein